MNKRIVVRADDVGYTLVNNIGAFEAFDYGIATAADVMLDTPGAVDALERLRNYPWISIGWHTHFWGSPVLEPQKVPTLLDPATGHFRKDIHESGALCYEELIAEMRAQMNRCVRILGKAPDTCMMFGGDTPFEKAQAQICREFGIVTDFARKVQNTDDGLIFSDVDEKWAERKIYWLAPGPAYDDLQSDSIEAHSAYDPIRYYTEDRGGMSLLPEGNISGQAWHPGYVDYYMCRCGDKGPNARKFIECRPIDTHALCSQELKAWVRDNHVELMNFRDALYGTQEYQNHLRSIGSDLCVL